jgi:hypothetical protein
VSGRSNLILALAATCAAPAVLSALSGPLEAATGWPATRLVASAFSALGVTNHSPLSVRQDWYFGAYILAPLAGTAIAVSAVVARTRPWWPFALAASAGTLVAVFWTVWSLLDA